MNRSFIVAVLTVTIILMISATGYAYIAPHNHPCDNCHGMFVGNSLPVTSTNACLTCHNSQGEASRMPVDPDAMSNYFGSAIGQPATGSRSTHTWGAYSAVGHPYNPAAMVHEPTAATDINWGYPSTYSFRNTNANVYVGSLACGRCHDSKSIDTYNTIKPFMRTIASKDVLCADCHRARNLGATAVRSGTHPINYRSYSAAYKSNTTAFRKVPKNANTYNRTSDLGKYFSTGQKIVCLTCHAPHYADSSSATLDNRSTANGFAQDEIAKGLKGRMQNSKGQLLRTDPIGLTANAVNICSSCHKETANLNHNGKGQNIQCDHCHGAHVDYTGDNSLPNLNLLRRNFSNMSTDKKKLGANVQVLFNNNTGYKRADNKGICQICHDLPETVEAHSISNATNADCRDCHNHQNGFSPSSCSTCHGQPPMTGSVGGPSGKSSSSYSLDESYTPHATHADSGYYKYACKNCHYSGTKAGYHNAGSSFANVFVDTAGSVGDIAGFKNFTTNYNRSARTCSNVYCHSNGNPRGGPMAFSATFGWEYGKNKIIGQANECSNCHQVGSNLVTNAHSTHITSNSIKCIVCHAATVTEYGAIADRTKHANGAKDVSFVTRPPNYRSVFEGTFNAGNATCTNSCHTNGLGFAPISTARWTESARKGAAYCGSCHAKVPATSLHTTHFTGAVGPKLGTDAAVCDSCHNYSAGAITHANGLVDLKSSTCSPCHPGTAPIWVTGSKVSCESCHVVAQSQVDTYYAPLKDINNTVGHGKYSSASLHVTCTSCHNALADHIGAVVSEKRLLLVGNALCDSCHLSSAGKILQTNRTDLFTHGGTTPFNKYTTTNDGRAKDCSGCHDTHGTANLLNMRTSINGHNIVYTNTSTGFYVTAATNGIYNGLCQVCHTKTIYYKNNASPSGHYTKRCLDCHKHKSYLGSTFAFQGVGGECGGCHGYPPVRNTDGMNIAGNYSSAKLQDYSGGGGAHSVKGHVLKTVSQTQEFVNCTNCHYNVASHNGGSMPVKPSFVDVVVDPKFKFNNMSAIKYNAQTCSNVSCHFKKTPNWTNGQ